MSFLLSIAATAPAVLFVLAILMNVSRKNTSLTGLFVAQSALTASALLALAYTEGSTALLYAAFLTLIVKAVLGGAFFFRVIGKYQAHFSASSYTSAPLTLLMLTGITLCSYALFGSSPGLALVFAGIFSTCFLMVNRRGALASAVGILALENGIVLAAALLGLQHSFALETAIAFDIAVWVVIATAFFAMMHRQFGSADAAPLSMTHLTEE